MQKKHLIKRAVYTLLLILYLLYGFKMIYNISILVGNDVNLKMTYLCQWEYWKYWTKPEIRVCLVQWAGIH